MNPMRTTTGITSPNRHGWTLLALLVLNGCLASAQPTNPPTVSASATNPPTPPANRPAPVDYSSFKIVTDRNIFNPNRSSRSYRSEPREYRRPARVESFSLVGTMIYEKGTFAFFDGSSSAYRKALDIADVIADYVVTDVGMNYVKLATETNELELRIGMQMRREDEGEWRLLNRGEVYESRTTVAAVADPNATASTNADPATASTGGDAEPAAPPSATIPSPATTAPAATSGGSESDVLKRLMERRAQELNR